MNSKLLASTSEAFSYDLPSEKIAQRPVYPYDTAKLLVVHRREEKLQESSFDSILDFFEPGDLLVFNNTRVIPARLFGKLESLGREVEVLLLDRQDSTSVWRCMGRPLKKFKKGERIVFSEGVFAEIGDRVDEKGVYLEFQGEQQPEQAGIMPIPPYIRNGQADERDVADYQPHFAEISGSVASPTASLHFTPELLEKIKHSGVGIDYLTLHVGSASFLPLWAEGESQLSAPGKERYVYSSELLERVQKAKKSGGRVIAVGTTVVRALESMSQIQASDGEKLETELFISPGYEFSIVDAMITNFHQPRTTHLLLVQAFIGRALLESSYAHGLEHNFRFLSYGDGMLLL